MYYRLREKHFFDGLYRTMLGFDSERKRPVVAKAVIAYIDEALMLGRLDRTLFRKHCDVSAQRHVDLLPGRILTEEELSCLLEDFSSKVSG
jgi:hypothetical protein